MCQVELADGANLSLSWWKDPPGMTVWLCELMTLHSFCRGYISTPWGLIYAQPNSDSHSAELSGLWRGLRKQHKTLLKSSNCALVHLYSSLKILFSLKKKKEVKGVSVHHFLYSSPDGQCMGFPLTSLHIYVGLAAQCLFTKAKWVSLWACCGMSLCSSITEMLAFWWGLALGDTKSVSPKHT